MEDTVIRNKKLFEKQLTKLEDFSKINTNTGSDSQAVLFLPEHQLLITGGLKSSKDTSQKLTLFQMNAKIDQTQPRNKYQPKPFYKPDHQKRNTPNNTSLITKIHNIDCDYYKKSNAQLTDPKIKSKEGSQTNQKKTIKIPGSRKSLESVSGMEVNHPENEGRYYIFC